MPPILEMNDARRLPLRTLPMTASAAPEWYPGLQALRGIAALGVFVYHLVGVTNVLAPVPLETFYAFNTGGIGVMLFFGLSGFLILGRTRDRADKFLLDRARRIFPLYWLSLLLTAIAMSFMGFTMRLSPMTVLLLPAAEQSLTLVPYWSLVFEVHFYFLVLILALLLGRLAILAVLAWGLVAWFSATWPVVFERDAFPADWQSVYLAAYNAFFAIGALAGLSFLRPRWAWPSALLAVFFFFGYWRTVPWFLVHILELAPLPAFLVHPSFGYATMAYGTFFAVRACLAWQAQGLLGRILARVGDASYGIYLIHATMLQLGRHFMQEMGWSASFWPSLLVLGLIAAIPSYAFGLFDVRLQRLMKRGQRWLAGRRRGPLGAGIAGITQPAGAVSGGTRHSGLGPMRRFSGDSGRESG